MNNTRPTRLIMLAQDIIALHSCSPSTASRKTKEIKMHLEKKPHQHITVQEFCDFYSLPYLETCKFLKIA